MWAGLLRQQWALQDLIQSDGQSRRQRPGGPAKNDKGLEGLQKTGAYAPV
jgi:hypothetical protein